MAFAVLLAILLGICVFACGLWAVGDAWVKEQERQHK